MWKNWGYSVCCSVTSRPRSYHKRGTMAAALRDSRGRSRQRVRNPAVAAVEYGAKSTSCPHLQTLPGLVHAEDLPTAGDPSCRSMPVRA